MRAATDCNLANPPVRRISGFLIRSRGNIIQNGMSRASYDEINMAILSAFGISAYPWKIGLVNLFHRYVVITCAEENCQ